MCLLLYLQVKIKYGEERHYCPSEPPCSLPFLEPYEEHEFVYHTKKTAALICGCGYGHILAHKFVQHVKDIHGVQLTTDEAAERHFWHNLVEFERVYGCHRNSKRVKCTFRSPIEHLMLNVHACVTDAQPSPYPRYDEFVRLLPKWLRPTFGFPQPEGREAKWQTARNQRPRSASRHRGSRKRTRSRPRQQPGQQDQPRQRSPVPPPQHQGRQSRRDARETPLRDEQPDPAVHQEQSRPPKRLRRDVTTRLPETFTEQDRLEALRIEYEHKVQLAREKTGYGNLGQLESEDDDGTGSQRPFQARVQGRHQSAATASRAPASGGARPKTVAFSAQPPSPGVVSLLSEGECSASDMEVEPLPTTREVSMYSYKDYTTSNNNLALVPYVDTKGRLGLSNNVNFINSLKFEPGDLITAKLKDMRLRLQSDDSTSELQRRASELNLMEQRESESPDVIMEEPEETQVMPVHTALQPGTGWQPTPEQIEKLAQAVSPSSPSPPTAVVQEAQQTPSAQETSSTPVQEPSVQSATPDTAQQHGTSASASSTVQQPEQPEIACRDVRITSGQYIQVDGDLIPNPDYKPKDQPKNQAQKPSASQKPQKPHQQQNFPPNPNPQQKPASSKILSEFGETEFHLDIRLLELLKIPPVLTASSPYVTYDKEIACNMKGFAEYGDVRVSDDRKGSGKKLRLFSKYSMFPGQYAILAMTSKPIAYVTITCHPRFHAKEDYSRLWKQYNPSQFPVIVETLDVRPGNLAMMRNVVAISMVLLQMYHPATAASRALDFSLDATWTSNIYTPKTRQNLVTCITVYSLEI